jgi:polyisoprenoid-binding protein YceI
MSKDSVPRRAARQRRIRDAVKIMRLGTRVAKRACFLFLMATLASRAAAAQDATREIGSSLLSGTLSFVGHATVGDFVGATSQLSGVLTGDLPAARGWIETPVATLVTRNDRRDRDLRASLEADRYPTMRFDLDSTVMVISRGDARDVVDVQLCGRLAIHGVTRAVELPATVSRLGDTLHVTSAFPLDLADYRIGGLKKLFGLLRMGRRIEVRVDLRFLRAINQ